MAQQVFPTKGNLLSAQKSLALATMGYDLMDRKRNILIREMMTLVDQSKKLRKEIGETFEQAYKALQKANISTGVIERAAQAVPVEDGLDIHFRSVMGVDIPMVELSEKALSPSYGLLETNSELDDAYVHFNRVKQMSATLAEIDNSVYRLAHAIIKTQRRANALKNVVIPNYQHITRFITSALEEKEREEFSRLKVIKATKLRVKQAEEEAGEMAAEAGLQTIDQ